MEVSVIYQGRNYKYAQVGKIQTWIGEDQMAVPVMLHSSLREKAVSEGADSSIFSTIDQERPSEEKEKVVKKSKTKTKKLMKNGFNPFLK